MPSNYAIALGGLAVAWLLASTLHPRVRAAFGNGFRCMRRYPDLWRIPAVFGVAYALFNLAALILFLLRIDTDLGDWIGTIEAGEMPTLAAVAASSWVSALEGSAKIFNAFTTTFPLSAVGALALLCNVGGTMGELVRSVRRRFPRGVWLLLPSLLVCALAAIAKPFVYLLLPEILAGFSTGYTLLGATLINLASFVFELLLGVFFLTYLMLLAFAWTRGMHFPRHRLVSFALRRTGFVLKWSLVIVAAAGVLVIAPGLVAALLPAESSLVQHLFAFGGNIGLPALAMFMLFYCAVQTTLVFHNESLREAMHDSLAFTRRHLLPVVLFIAASLLLHGGLAGAQRFVQLSYGAESSAGAVAGAGYAIFEALLAGWLIASWVCLYRSLTGAKRDIVF